MATINPQVLNEHFIQVWNYNVLNYSLLWIQFYELNQVDLLNRATVSKQLSQQVDIPSIDIGQLSQEVDIPSIDIGQLSQHGEVIIGPISQVI